jgi:hypothetical protein
MAVAAHSGIILAVNLGRTTTTNNTTTTTINQALAITIKHLYHLRQT